MKKRLIMVLAVMMIAVYGCQNDNEEQNSGASDETGNVEALEDDAGNEVDVPENPERIVAPYLEDDILTLEEKPVVQWSVNDGGSIQDYLQEEGLEGLELIPHDLPFEVVASHEPDLILLSSSDFADDESYSNYSSIAPTFVVESGSYDDWRERLGRVSEIFGKEDMAEEKIDEYESLAEEVRTGLPDETAMSVWKSGESYFISNADKSSGEVLYNDLGLGVPPVVEEVSEGNETPWIEISLESLAESEVDHIFFTGDEAGDAEEAFSEDVFQNIPAVENGNVYEYTGADSWLYSGYIANTQIIEDVEEEFSE
ncbi:ABC transporter substrate-binding protein [Lacicoccus qingdaonensis]|uniref:Iron complex transport system substrate-binding protein n=1 Tax=Lacicoccus qingdaonensis TaxID=576118 RepID=A0A1G9G9N0_9BACL|nr:ABC transporter substrate-binding protein [Salinicoccus qingdaonensis]SDK97390.1 iron complex transport system substrate-binding protein [Salinicoccus qingdaonensis]